jgi:hypothetical protein
VAGSLPDAGRNNYSGYMIHRSLLALCIAVHVLAPASADERLRDIACRSVHLAYDAPAGVAFYNEVTVEHSAPGTYFCVCGYNKGYFGLQELANGKKLVIFSVWDPGAQNDPQAVDAEQRVKLLHKDKDVRVGRFGNEGTGGQSFFDFDWKNDETYRFLVTAKPDGKRTEFAGYFYVPADKSWKHLVTFSTITDGKPLGGYYSFVEDFRRNRQSTKHVRTARFGNGWIKRTEGEWRSLAEARFTADANPVMNINAGTRDDCYFLATGGDTQNTDTPLNKHIRLKTPAERPADLP